MAIKDDDLHNRNSLYDYHQLTQYGQEEDEVRVGNRFEWHSPSPDPEAEDSDMELFVHPNSFDLNSNLFRKEAPEVDHLRKALVPPENEQIAFPPPFNTLPKFPKEKRKTLLAFGLVLVSLLLNSISIALTHDRVPDGPPLPDVTHFLPPLPQFMTVPDVLVIFTMVSCFLTILLHRHRWIVARRVFFTLSMLYTMRSVTMYSTVLPIANNTVYCSPKSNSTSAAVLLARVGELLGGGGMQISGQKKSCGDYIYSGHTVILVCGYLILKEYSPRKFVILHWISWGMSWCGMAILLLARGHYTIDVLIGYYAATRTFWTYHSLCNNSALKTRTENNYHSNVWWFPVFEYFEGNVTARLPKEYSLPWSLQKHKLRHTFFR